MFRYIIVIYPFARFHMFSSNTSLVFDPHTESYLVFLSRPFEDWYILIKTVNWEETNLLFVELIQVYYNVPVNVKIMKVPE
jgi:hypothetical protein